MSSTPTAPTPTENKSLSNNAETFFLTMLGVVVLAVHSLLFFFSKDIFNIIMSLYVIAFAIIFMVFMQKKKTYMTTTEYNFLSYTCFFMIGL